MSKTTPRLRPANRMTIARHARVSRDICTCRAFKINLRAADSPEQIDFHLNSLTSAKHAPSRSSQNRIVRLVRRPGTSLLSSLTGANNSCYPCCGSGDASENNPNLARAAHQFDWHPAALVATCPESLRCTRGLIMQSIVTVVAIASANLIAAC